jgi:hypothetical protein
MPSHAMVKAGVLAAVVAAARRKRGSAQSHIVGDESKLNPAEYGFEIICHDRHLKSHSGPLLP